MTIPASYQIFADFVGGGTVPEADCLSVSISRDVGEIFSDLRTSEAEFTFDNVEGVYSPDNVTGPNSMQLGGQIRIVATTDAGSTYGLFNGFVKNIRDNAVLGQRQVSVRAADVAQFLRRDVNTGILLDTNTAELLTHVMSDANIPSSMFELDNKLVDKMPFAFIDRQSAGSAIGKIVESGAHFSVVDGDGVFAVRNRNVDVAAPTVQSYDNYAFGLTTILDDRTLMNDVRVRGTLRKAATTGTSIAGLAPGDIPTVAGSSSLNFFLEYQDPTTLETPLPVNSFSAPVANSDYVIVNSAGADVTATTSVAVTAFAMSAKVEIFNGAADQAFINEFFLTGIPLLRQPPFTSRVEDETSQDDYGRRAFNLSSDLVQGVDFVDSYADFLDFRFSKPLAEVTVGQRNLYPDILQIDLLNTIHFVESHTRINSTFLVLGIEHAIDFQSVGTTHSVSYRCRLQQAKAFLILDEDPEGKLDIRTNGF